MEKTIVNIEDLTLGDLEDIEKIAGSEAAGLLMEGKVRPSVVVALMFVTQRKTNPDITLDDVRAMKLSAFDVGQGDGKADPTTGAPAPKQGAPVNGA